MNNQKLSDLNANLKELLSEIMGRQPTADEPAVEPLEELFKKTARLIYEVDIENIDATRAAMDRIWDEYYNIVDEMESDLDIE